MHSKNIQRCCVVYFNVVFDHADRLNYDQNTGRDYLNELECDSRRTYDEFTGTRLYPRTRRSGLSLVV